MADVVDARTRSRMMAGIRGKDTKPEIRVRRYMHAVGLRYRLHAAGLPGRPDLVFPRAKVAVMVHGCFWHQHPGCRYAATPSTKVEFWQKKFEANARRDRSVVDQLTKLGWTPLIIWECETRDETALDALAWEILARSASHLPLSSDPARRALALETSASAQSSGM